MSVLRTRRTLLAALGAWAVTGCGEAPPHASVQPGGDWRVPVLPALGADFEAFFSTSEVRALEVRFSVDEWNALLHDFDENPRNETCRQATVVFGRGDGARELAQAGVRLRGNLWSRERPEGGTDLHEPLAPLRRVHFKVKLDETFDGDEGVYGSPSVDLPAVPENDGRALFGVRGFNLKHNHGDATFVREVASYELFRRAGVQAPRAAFARLAIRVGDEPPVDFGVYELVEEVDKHWIRRRFGADGTLWKCLWQQEGPADLSRGDGDALAGSGRAGLERTDPPDAAQWSAGAWREYRPAYDLKTRKDDYARAEAALDSLVALLAGAPTRAQLEAAVDVQALLRAMAMNALVGMTDDYWRNGNNYYLLRSPADGRWLFVPYDYDHTLGIPCIGADPATSSFVGWGETRNGPVTPVLMERVLAIPEFRRDFLRYVEAYVSGPEPVFHPGTLGPWLGTLRDAIAPFAVRAQASGETPYSWDLGPITDYLATRVAAARAEVEAAGP